jgi:hypothetical protein
MQQLGVMKDRKANGSAIKARAHRGIRRLRKLTQTRSVGGRERERERERERARARFCVCLCVSVFLRVHINVDTCFYLKVTHTHKRTLPLSKLFRCFLYMRIHSDAVQEP